MFNQGQINLQTTNIHAEQFIINNDQEQYIIKGGDILNAKKNNLQNDFKTVSKQHMSILTSFKLYFTLTFALRQKSSAPLTAP